MGRKRAYIYVRIYPGNGGRDQNGWTALQIASAGGHAGVVEVLLQKSGQNGSGLTAIQHAARNGHVDVVKLLLTLECRFRYICTK
jgi:ankyrin repeat protein